MSTTQITSAMPSAVQDDTDSLFAEIIESQSLAVETETDPFAVPENLRPFDYKPSNREIREASETVFFTWLRSRLAGQETVPEPTPVEESACQTTPDVFFPDYADEREDADSLSDEQFAVIDHAAKIQALTAKAGCHTCPLVAQCLTSSVLREDEFGIWGGYAYHSRIRITAAFHRLRRAYNSDKTSDEERARLDVIARGY